MAAIKKAGYKAAEAPKKAKGWQKSIIVHFLRSAFPHGGAVFLCQTLAKRCLCKTAVLPFAFRSPWPSLGQAQPDFP